MGSDRLDHFIKRKVQNHETVSDTNLLWQKIQAKQTANKKDKRRFFFIWFFAGLLLICSGLGLFFHAGNSAEESNAFVAQPSDNNDPVQTSIDLNNPISESKIVEKHSKTKEANLSLKHKQKQTKKEDSISNFKSLKIERASSTSHSSKSSLSSPQGFNKKNIALALSENNNTTEVKIQKNIKPSDLNITFNNDENSNKNTNNNKVFKSDFKELTALPLRIPAIDYSNSFEQLKKGSNDFLKQKKSKQYSLTTELFFNYGVVDKTLKSSNDAYLNIRDSHETPLDVISAGVNFSIQHKSSFYLKTGLEYQQITERFENYSTWNSTIIEPDQIIAITYDMDGNSVNTIGDGLVDETYFSSKKIYNRYRSFELPVLIGYASSKQKLGWFAEGGLALNLSFKPDGEILNESEQSIFLKEDPSYFKSRTGISLVSAIGVSYQLNHQFSLSAAPNFKYQLSSVASAINPVDQKYLTLGMRLALRYHW